MIIHYLLALDIEVGILSGRKETSLPTSIEIIGDKVISLWLDPSTIDNHYGNTPVYGIVIEDDDEHRPDPLKGNSTQMGK